MLAGASQDEAQKLQIEPGSPVLTIKGVSRDQQHRTLQFIDVVAVPGGLPAHYRYRAVPAESQPG